MNTADRSIKLLDSALRRRFAFVELMPKPSLLQGGKIGGLLLDDFLEALTRELPGRRGEKQIGHSFLMDRDGPISEQEEFARRFRQEILPLLQEYCYDDYAVLAYYIGKELVDQDGKMLNEERLADSDRLTESLEADLSVMVGEVKSPSQHPIAKSIGEWGSCFIEGSSLDAQDRRLATRLTEEPKGRLAIDELHNGVRITARSWVGLVQFSAFQLQIVAKLAGDNLNLVELIDYATGLDALARYPGFRSISGTGTSLLRSYRIAVRRSVRKGPTHGLLSDYCEVEDDLPVVRGRLLVRQQVLKRFGKIDRLECRCDEYLTNIPENQIVLAGLSVCASACRECTRGDASSPFADYYV